MTVLVPVFIFLIFSVPVFISAVGILLAPTVFVKSVMLLLAPLLFACAYVVVAGGLSNLGRKAIIPGTFPRDLRHPVYGPRRLYGLCWTSIYYFTPLYFVLLSVPALRKFLFRLFGYQGSNDITIYPDAWLRDLPLLKFADKCYIANRSTIGTNICLSNGNVIVDEVTIGPGALVGHLSLVGPGAVMEKGTELGVHTALGIRARMQEGSKTGICVTIFHGVNVGKRAEIGSCAYLGLRAKIGDGVKVPAGANIPAGSIIENQNEMNEFHTAETKVLREKRMEGVKALFSVVPDEMQDPKREYT